MAEKNLVQNIDKISYGVAGVLALALLALPFLTGGDLDEKRGQLNAATREFLDNTTKELPPPKDDIFPEALEEQWDPGRGEYDMAHMSGPAPALLKVVRAVERAPVVHEAGVITEVSCQRDSERQQPFILVKGAMNEANQYIVIEEVRLYRQTADSGRWVPVKVEAKGDFEYSDFNVKPGQTYSYKFVTRASRDPNAGPDVLPTLDSPNQESGEVGPTPAVPYDVSFDVMNFIAPTPNAPIPVVTAKMRYWNYETGEVVNHRGRFEEKVIFGEGRYLLHRVDDRGRKVELVDKRRRARHQLTSKDEPYEVECWESMTGIAAETDEFDDDDDVDDGVGAQPEPADTGTAPGDDDDDGGGLSFE